MSQSTSCFLHLTVDYEYHPVSVSVGLILFNGAVRFDDIDRPSFSHLFSTAGFSNCFHFFFYCQKNCKKQKQKPPNLNSLLGGKFLGLEFPGNAFLSGPSLLTCFYVSGKQAASISVKDRWLPNTTLVICQKDSPCPRGACNLFGEHGGWINR